MANIVVVGEITKTTDQELFDALTWLSSTYAAEIFLGTVSGSKKTVNFRMRASDYITGVNMMLNLRTQFGVDLTEYDLQMSF